MADMATQPITGLPSKTASQMANTDKLLGIDNAEGYQMLIQDLGDYIIQHATSSLAGSNQTLAAVIDSLKSNTWALSGGTEILADANLNEYTTPGNYYCKTNATAATLTNCPVASGFIMKVEYSLGTGTPRQTLRPYDTNDVWYRKTVTATWEKNPTRAEMNNAWTLSNSTNSKITSGQDLDSFLTPGVFDCASSSIASSLLHRPEAVTSGFRLIVSQSGYGTSSYAIQIILIGSGSAAQQREFRRAYLGTPPNGTWSDWVQTPTRAEFDTLNSNTYRLTIGTPIPSGSDLDTFLTPGNYFCSNSTQAATLLHCPITNKGFAMKVEATNTNASVLQTIFTRDTQEIIYRRSYYSGSSSFDSDWIKQPTRAEMDTTYRLMSVTAITANANLNSIVALGEYSAETYDIARSVTNLPSGVTDPFRLRVERMLKDNANYIRQTIKIYNSYDAYERYTNNNGTVWSAWQKMPTRAEMDAVSAYSIPLKLLSKANASSYSLNLPSNGRYMIVTVPNGSRDMTFVLATVYGNGTVYINDLSGEVNTTFSTSANTLTATTATASLMSFSVLVVALDRTVGVNNVTIS